MLKIPRDQSFDSALDVLREGFPFILNRVQRYQTDIFQIRLGGMKAICLHGPDATRLFYDTERFVRKGAVPRRIQTTLMGQDAIQTHDGAEHRCRKDMFMSVMTPGSRHRLMALLADEWETYLHKWEQEEKVELFPEVQEILCRAACAWAGVPLKEKEVGKRARDFGAMIDAFGGVGPRHARGKFARRRAESWIRGVIRRVRRGKVALEEVTPAYVVAWHREPDGELFDTQMAALELINLLRPIVAIATYVTFAAKALHEHPAYRQLLRNPDRDYAELFVQEVRRFFPFAPFLGARVRDDFDWRGYYFPKGTLTLLDVYGTLHDAHVWQDPDVFWPERFENWQGSRFDFIPQGGGSYETGHRCAGEWITIEALKLAVTFMARRMRYQVPPQDLSYDLSRMPTLPRSGFVMQQVEAVGYAQPIAAPAHVAPGCPFHDQK